MSTFGGIAGIGACLLYPQKRTLIERVGMSALCQKRTFCAAAKTSLFDHLIGAGFRKAGHIAKNDHVADANSGPRGWGGLRDRRSDLHAKMTSLSVFRIGRQQFGRTRVAIVPSRVIHHVGNRQLPLREQISRIDRTGQVVEKSGRIFGLRT